MRKSLFALLIALLILIQVSPALSEEIDDFDTNMKDWRIKIELASKYLRKAEESLKSGNRKQGCLMQKKAGEMGVIATDSLIRAFEIKRSNERELNNLKSGLNKWKELRDFCKSN